MTGCRHSSPAPDDPQKESIDMSKFANALAASVLAAFLLSSGASAAPMSDADKAALKAITDTCYAQVKEFARYNETSWWQRHKMRKKCIADALAKR
jgi:hypothetical protein